MDKQIVTLTLKASELNKQFGNPRKISKKKLDELKESFEMFGDFGIYVIDENRSIIAGNQRHSVVMNIDPETPLLCKQLIGYSEAEKRAINIKDNTHSGEWDLSLLADWTADLTVDLGLTVKEDDPDERKIDNMDPVRFEKYNYVLIACKNEIDYNELTRNLGIEGAKMRIAKRKLHARAIWYDQMKAQITPKVQI